MWRLSARPVALCLALSFLAAAISARADHFTFRRETVDSRERGIVVSHQADLFVIASSMGGLSPAERAEVVAERLEGLARAHNTANQFTVGFRSGEVILLQPAVGTEPSHVILTVDRRLAPGDNPERLARWWLALLRDHLALAAGREPLSTSGTAAGDAFAALYRAVGRSEGAIDSETIDRAFDSLSPGLQRGLKEAAYRVPASFGRDAGAGNDAPDQEPRGEKPLPRRLPDLHEKPAPADTRAKEVPEPEAKRDTGIEQQHPREGTDDRPMLRRSGDYVVRLLTPVSSLAAGEPADILLKLSRGTTEAAEEPLEDAIVRVWIAKSGEKSGRPMEARAGTRAGLYRIDEVALPESGPYRVIVGVLTDDGEVFKVAFDNLGIRPIEPRPAPTKPADDRPALRMKVDDVEAALVTDPENLVSGDDVLFELKLIDIRTGKPLAGAAIKVWVLAQDTGFKEPPFARAQPLDAPGLYGWHTRFESAGKGTIGLWITLPDAKRIRMEFPITVRK